MSERRFFRRAIALPTDHGSWVFLLGPLLIGLFAGGRWTTVSTYLVVASLCAFLARQPITLAIKVLSGRRPRATLAPALFWLTFYAGIGLLHVTGLVIRGFGYLLYLAIPGIPVFLWYLLLIARRAERRQWPVEVLGAGVLALVAPAAYWVGVGGPAPLGWGLWILTWAQSVVSILFVYLRLEQRALPSPPARASRLRMALPALGSATLALAVVAGAGLAGPLPRWLFVPFLVQWFEVLRGTFRPAIGVRPAAIGWRQLSISAVCILLFVVAWPL